MATTRPRPTATSQAATTITISAKICPPMSPCAREKATSARFAAFSISSRQSRITSGLRRVSTPPAPMQKISAETTRYQVMLIAAGGPGPDRGRVQLRVVAVLDLARMNSATEISRASDSPERRRARITAPTAAISSSSEATSNATR